MSSVTPTASTPPAHPAAYLRVAARLSTRDGLSIVRQQDMVLSAAAALGWPAPVVCTDVGTPGWNRPGPGLASLAVAIRAGRHDAVITCDLAWISRDPAGLAAFHALCSSHATTLHTVTDGPAPAATLPILASIG
jgi:DNA invertase Pin-like site-specific DNA recombinase